MEVNINKVATLRNARGGEVPSVLAAARTIIAAGCRGITVHPRADERHIRRTDVVALAAELAPLRDSVEFNIEGDPRPDLLELVCDLQPHQCTLVPDTPGQLTSDAGWDTLEHASFLREVIAEFHKKNIRVSLFVDPVAKMVEGAKAAGADRIEFYTGPFAHHFPANPQDAVAPYTQAALVANAVGIGINAGHDLNRDNLKFFRDHCPQLLEVSIGHALISDALYYGLANTIRMYLRQLR